MRRAGTPLARLTLVLAATSLMLAFAQRPALAGGLAGYWPLNGDGRDRSGGGYDLAIEGGAGFGAGPIGAQALVLGASASQFAIGGGDDPAGKLQRGRPQGAGRRLSQAARSRGPDRPPGLVRRRPRRWHRRTGGPRSACDTRQEKRCSAGNKRQPAHGRVPDHPALRIRLRLPRARSHGRYERSAGCRGSPRDGRGVELRRITDRGCRRRRSASAAASAWPIRKR